MVLTTWVSLLGQARKIVFFEPAPITVPRSSRPSLKQGANLFLCKTILKCNLDYDRKLQSQKEKSQESQRSQIGQIGQESRKSKLSKVKEVKEVTKSRMLIRSKKKNVKIS